MKTHKQSLGLRSTRGYTLIEALIVAAVIAAGIAGVYAFYQRVFASKTTFEESQNTAELTNRISKAYGAMANFTGISTASLINEGVVPSTMTVTDGVINSGFGGDIDVIPATIGGLDGAGFTVRFSEVPQKRCASFVKSTNSLNRYQQITVTPARSGNVTVVGNKGAVNEEDLLNICSVAETSTIAFTYKEAQTGGAPETSMDICVTPEPQTRTLACPMGHAGLITQQRTGFCDSAYGLPVWNEYTVVSNTCQLVCTPHPTSPETRNQPCSPGYLGTILEKRVSTCPTQTGAPVWGAWQVASDSCAIACVEAAPEMRSVACPEGYVGDRKERRTSTCTATTGYPSWSSWTVYQDNCTKECIVPSPSEESRWVPSSKGCGTGYTGSIYFEFEQKRTASCPPSSSNPVWSAYANTGATRNEDASQCISACTPNTVTEQWVKATDSCAIGYSGAITYEKKQTRTSKCLPGASSPNTSPWVDTGERRNETSSCTGNPCAIAPNARSWNVGDNTCMGNPSALSVPHGQSVSWSDATAPITGKLIYSCNAGNLVLESSTCAISHCQVAANAAFDWAVGPATCAFKAPAVTSFVPVGGFLDASDSTEPTTGEAKFSCPATGVLKTTAEPGATCVGSCSPTPPTPDKRPHNGCPVNTYGSWTQENPYEPGTYPTCWSQTNNVWGPTAPPSGACTACPSPSPVLEKQWVERSRTCPTGTTGTWTTEYEQSRTTTTSYSCPAGTASLPAPTVSSTAYVDTGVTRNDKNNCLPDPCAIPANHSWTGAGGSCSASKPITGTTIASGTTITYTDSSAPIGGTFTYSCDKGQLSMTGSSCNITHCTSPIGNKFNWSVGPAACDATQSTAAFVAVGSMHSISDNIAPTAGTGNFTCLPNGTFSAPLASSTCTGSCAANPPAPDTRTVAGCPVDTYGSWTQNNPYENGGYPSCWSQSVNTWSPATAPAGACKTCPAAVNDKDPAKIWTRRNVACPSGTTGTRSFEYEQERTRKTEYFCPAGTATLPAATVTYGATYTDTGVTRNEINSCTGNPCAVPSSQSWSSGSCSGGPNGGVTSIPSGSSVTFTDASAPVGGTATYSCLNGVLNSTPTAQSCATTHCNAAINFTWSGGGAACNASGSGYVAVGSSVSLSDTTPATLGSASFSCTGTGAFTQTSGSCGNQCVLPSPNPQTESQAGPLLSQTIPCAPDENGSIYQNSNSIQYRTTTYACPSTGVGAPYVSNQTAWSTPVATGWWTSYQTCTKNCQVPSPNPVVENVNQSTTGYCPSGQVTSSGATTFAQTQYGTKTTTYFCPAGASSPSSSTSFSWGATSPDPSSVCRPQACNPASPPPPVDAPYGATTSSTTTGNCPTGFGAGPMEYSYSNTPWRTTHYACGNGVWSSPTVSGYSNDRVVSTYVGAIQGCVACKTPDYNVPAYDSGSDWEACPNGKPGGRLRYWERTGTKTVHYQCATGVPVTSVSYEDSFVWGVKQFTGYGAGCGMIEQ